MKEIIVRNITKKYGSLVALNSISFEVEKGEIFGIIGSDGAGKTTLMRILTSLMLPNNGEAIVSSYNIIKDYKKLRAEIGYMPGQFSLYMDLTVEENMNFFATLFGTTVEKNYDLVKDIYSQIEPFKDRRAANLSGGMKQKLALSCALIHAPKVLFLDEPTTGVDPVSRREFWEMLQRLREKGITILVSTPYMDEAKLCDRVAFIQDGTFLSIDSPQGMLQKYSEELYSVASDLKQRLLIDCRAFNAIKSCFSFGSVHHITVKDDFNPDKLKAYLVNLGHKEVVVERIEPTIEDCYMKQATKK